MVLLCSGAKYIGRISSYKKCYISDKKETLKKFPNKDKISDLSCVYEINCLLLQIEISSRIIEIVSLFCLKELKTKY